MAAGIMQSDDVRRGGDSSGQPTQRTTALALVAIVIVLVITIIAAARWQEVSDAADTFLCGSEWPDTGESVRPLAHGALVANSYDAADTYSRSNICGGRIVPSELDAPWWRPTVKSDGSGILDPSFPALGTYLQPQPRQPSCDGLGSPMYY